MCAIEECNEAEELASTLPAQLAACGEARAREEREMLAEREARRMRIKGY